MKLILALILALVASTLAVGADLYMTNAQAFAAKSPLLLLESVSAFLRKDMAGLQAMLQSHQVIGPLTEGLVVEKLETVNRTDTFEVWRVRPYNSKIGEVYMFNFSLDAITKR